ncbi:hypothetical protein [Streptomyces sp. CS131]|uniref:hypothetical protein n=1 Tax=Streptomyces sp. CS131 TaxID=2162711 RepID=UPI001EF5F4E6|nr:hypothetical protein [Streptomyces sp. CS131]
MFLLEQRFTLLLAAALSAVLTMPAVAPAGAAGKPSRSNGVGNRVIFVHGHAPFGKHDCTKTFSAARKHFTNKKWKGNLLTFGYYSGNTKCSANVTGSRDTAIKDVAKKFANYVARNYTAKGIEVDVVAHSMGVRRRDGHRILRHRRHREPRGPVQGRYQPRRTRHHHHWFAQRPDQVLHEVVQLPQARLARGTGTHGGPLPRHDLIPAYPPAR